jgi:hypothetical protein
VEFQTKMKRFSELAFRTAWGALKASHRRIEWVAGERTMHNRNLRAITGKRIPCWGCWFASLPGLPACRRTHFQGMSGARTQSLSQWRRPRLAHLLQPASPAAIPLKMLKMTLGAARFGLWRASRSPAFIGLDHLENMHEVRCRTLIARALQVRQIDQEIAIAPSSFSHPVLRALIMCMQLMPTTYLVRPSVRRDLCARRCLVFGHRRVGTFFARLK